MAAARGGRGAAPCSPPCCAAPWALGYVVDTPLGCAVVHALRSLAQALLGRARSLVERCYFAVLRGMLLLLATTSISLERESCLLGRASYYELLWRESYLHGFVQLTFDSVSIHQRINSSTHQLDIPKSAYLHGDDRLLRCRLLYMGTTTSPWKPSTSLRLFDVLTLDSDCAPDSIALEDSRAESVVPPASSLSRFLFADNLILISRIVVAQVIIESKVRKRLIIF